MSLCLHIFSNAINKLYFKCGNFLSLWENNSDNPERLWRINKTDQFRGARAERKSVLWIERMLHWHVKNHQEQYDQLLAQLFIKYKSQIYEQFGWKHIQLNFEQAH